LSLQKVQDKISATQERFLLQPDISEKVYNKVMNELKADEQRMQTQIAELNINSRNYYSIMDELLPKLSDTKELFNNLPLVKKTAFLNLVFGNSLSYRDGIFRTPYLHFLFRHNVLILKEKGLLIIEQSFSNGSGTPGSSGNGSWLEHLKELWQILAA
jgi:hypothetical protein